MANRLYLTSDRSRVVEEGDPDAGFLIGDGASSADVTSQFGEDAGKLFDEHQKKSKPKAQAAEDDDAETKARTAAPDNKARKAPETK